MAEAVVSFALQTLRNLLVEETKLLSGVSSEVKALETHLKEMQCLVKDADKRQHQSNIVENWIAQIRNLAHRAEDVIETYAADEASSRRRRGFKKLLRRFCCALNQGFTLHQIGLEISDIKSEIARVTKSMQEYGIRSITQGEITPIIGGVDENQRKLERLTYPFEIEDCFVGMEDDLRKLVSLTVEDKEHQVISIWGMGGIGKTTIARKVYNHVATKRCFSSFAWVCITQQCQITSVLQEILKQLNPHQKEVFVNRMSIEELIPQLRQVQKEKRCMIVLDDIWTMNQWECLKHAFLIVGGNSKILLTTRKENIPNVGFSYELGLLNANDGWELLKKNAFSQNNASAACFADFLGEERSFQKIGKEMVNKCGYLPLAISLLGGILRRKSSLKEWELVNKNIDAYLYRGEDIPEAHKVHRVLDLSYEDLPSYLKPCFLYMGFLREDENIWVDKLYMLWIAQGMISNENQTRGETLMDLAEFYLTELASRCIVQVEVENVIRGRRYRTCQLHDTVRELCLSKGKKDHYSCLKVIHHQATGKLGPSFLGSETRHLAIQFGGEVLEHKIHGDFTATLEQSMKHARSLQFLSNGRTIEFQMNMIEYLRKLKLLRVLRFEKCRLAGRKLPKEIGDLINLRYLELKNCELDEVPSSVSNLANLYTFDLSYSLNVQVPNELNKLLRLKHLFLPLYDYKTESKNNYHLRLEGLNELESLYGFNSLVHDLKSISRMKNLQRLQAIVHDNESLSLIIDGINTTWSNLRHCWLEIRQGCEFNTSSEQDPVILNKLLACSNLTVLLIFVPMRELPQVGRTQSIFPSLISLVLQACEIKDEHMMEILEKLPCLERLRLLERSYMGENMVFHRLGFPRLKFLILERLPNLREWRVERGAMPMQSRLELHSCPKLETIPDGLRFIATLRELVITEMPELGKRVSAPLDDNGGQEGEDFDKVRHVPYIYIAIEKRL